MSGAMVEVYRTPSEADARFMRDLLAESGIPSELVLLPMERGDAAAQPGEEGVRSGMEEAVLRVAPGAEEEAVRVISEHLEGRGLRPEEGGAELTGGAACPNCAEPVPVAAGDACAECDYAVHPAPEAALSTLGRAFPDAATCCPDCCAPSTLVGGVCPDCRVPLEPIERAAPLCPAGQHMLVKGEAPGWVCPGCRAAWLDA